MSLWEYYLQFMGEILEGARPCPAPISLREEEEMARAMELLAQIETMGIPQFVRLCAEADGIEIPEEVYDDFTPDELAEILANLPTDAPEEAAAEEAPRSEPRNACEVLLDCCCLEENLLIYLMEVLREGDEMGFYKLAQVTTRMDLRPEAFLAWMASLELRADEEEQICAVLMDKCFARLYEEGEQELIAALLSGDQTIFERFRCDAPELKHLPEASFAWFERNYLDTYYPMRVLMKANGIAFPNV